MVTRDLLAIALLTACHAAASAFQCARIGLPLGESNRVLCRPLSSTFASVSENNGDGQNFVGKENKAMSFLKKIGKVGGAANRDFRFAIGVDEGSAGKSINGLTKSAASFKSCIESGNIDDLSESFPNTSCGTQWAGFTDQVISGMSMGNLARETFDGKTANVLRGSVSLANNGGFIQMATNLAPFESERRSVDASKYRGISLEVQSKREGGGTETFNVHIKNEACSKPYISYRAAFDVPNGEWTLVRIPFAAFRGKGAGIEDMPFDTTTLTRIGIVAIGREMKVQLAVAGIRFY